MPYEQFADRYAPIKRIDERLNQMEMYFRTRWYFNDQMVTILKAKPRDGCHLVINGLRASGPMKMKLTTICQPIEHSDQLGGKNTLHSLKLTPPFEKYIKTWQGIDLIVAEVQQPETYSSTVYYINASKLLDVIEQTMKTDFVPTDTGHYVCRAHFVFGIPLERLETDFGVFEAVDRVEWNRKNINIGPTTLPLPDYLNGRKKVQFMSEWKGASEETKKLYWGEFKLLTHTDQSRPVIVKVLHNQKELRFDSIKDAVETMSHVSGKKLCRGSFDNVLTGRAKTIRTPKGKITVRYDSVA